MVQVFDDNTTIIDETELERLRAIERAARDLVDNYREPRAGTAMLELSVRSLEAELESKGE